MKMINSNHNSRGYVLTCSFADCQTTILKCIDSFKCLGVDQCKRFLTLYPECSSGTCANDLFNGEDCLSVNGVKYLPCDETNEKQAKDCVLHCRGFYFTHNECALLDRFPVCKYSSLLFSSITSESASKSSTSTNTTTSSPTTTRVPTISSWSSLAFNGHTDAVYAVVVLKNGDLASADKAGKIIIWDSTTHRIKQNLTGHTGWVWCLTVLPNGDLVSGSTDKTIKIWDTVAGTTKRTLSNHIWTIHSLAVLNNGYLASASLDNTVKIWNPSSGSLIRTLTDGLYGVYSLAVLNNGYLASGDSLNKIRIWDALTGALIKQLDQTDYVWTMTVLSNGDLVSSNSRSINIWDTTNWTLKKTINAHSESIKAFTLFPNGDLASAGYDMSIKIWNPMDGSLKRTSSGHTSYIFSLALMNDGLLVSTDAELLQIELKSKKKSYSAFTSTAN
jgi:WD40 repeat protein